MYILFRAVEGFEYLVGFLFIDPLSGIAYFYQDIAGFYQGRTVLFGEHGQFFALVLRYPADPYCHVSFCRSELERIRQQVEKDFLYFGLIVIGKERFRQFVFQYECYLPVLCHTFEGAVHLLDECREIETSLLKDRFAGFIFLDIHQVVDKQQHTSGILFDQLQGILYFRRETDPLQ